jgi:catechol 2,3-dioxygenase-like lactoylglutathione lyase family enzyme
MLGIGQLVLGVADPERASGFWTQALDYVRRTPRSEDDWIVLVRADGKPGTAIALDISESPVQEHPRLHLDLFAGDSADQAAEVERLVSLGAEQVDWDLYPEDPNFVVLADTEGNRFCVCRVD